jgi:hypothetical protein
MNTKNILWMFASLLVTFVLLVTACAPAAATAPPAATEAPASSEGFDCHEDGDNMVCTFGDEDVIVMIPRQTNNGAFLYAVNLEMAKGLADFGNESRDQIAPNRLVINFELVLDPSSPGEYISDFDPPIELSVRYTQEDVLSVGSVENLQLGFWDDEAGYWVSFNQPEKYDFKVDGDGSGGYFRVTLSSWADRYIGMGFGAENFECNVDGDNMVCNYGANQDVIVNIPRQSVNNEFLYAVELPKGNLEELKSENDEFKPFRLVINLELALNPNVPEEHIDDFDPPIELGVRYTEDDVSTAGGLGNLQLGFWDEENNRWISFAQNGKYNFKVEGDEHGGHIWVTISSWGDRHIGFG